MHDGVHVGTCAVDGHVQQHLGGRQAVALDRLALEIDDDDLVHPHRLVVLARRGDGEEFRRAAYPCADVAGRCDDEAAAVHRARGIEHLAPLVLVGSGHAHRIAEEGLQLATHGVQTVAEAQPPLVGPSVVERARGRLHERAARGHRRASLRSLVVRSRGEDCRADGRAVAVDTHRLAQHVRQQRAGRRRSATSRPSARRWPGSRLRPPWRA